MRKGLLMAVGVIILAIPDILNQGAIGVLSVSVFISAFFLIREERGFCLLCAGIPSAIVAGWESPLRSLLILIFLTGLLLTEGALLSDRRELTGYIAFSGMAALSVWAIGIFRHAALPLIILGILAVFASVMIRISEYRLKWRFEHEEQ